MIAACQLFLWGENERRPHHAGVVWIIEVSRHDANDRKLFLVETDRFADNARITAKVLLPETMLEHHHLLAPRLAVLWEKGPTLSSFNTQSVKEPGGYSVAGKSFRT